MKIFFSYFFVLTTIVILQTQSTQAQDVFYNDGATFHIDGADVSVTGGDAVNADQAGASRIYLVNDGNFVISGNFTNGDTLAVILGTVDIGGDYQDGAIADAFVYNEDTIIVRADFGGGTGLFWTDTAIGGVLSFESGVPRVMNSNQNSLYHEIVFDGGGTKTVSGGWQTKDANFLDGIVIQSSTADTFAIVNGSVLAQSATSYYDGEFFNYGQGTREFPIGNGADYRPVRLIGLGSPAFIGFRVSPFAPAGYAPTPGPGMNAVTDQRYWVANDVNTLYTGAQVELTFMGPDTVNTDAATLNDLLVAQSDSTIPYQSIGNAGAAPIGGGYNTILSSLIAGHPYLTLGGGCNNVKLDIRVLLEGAYSGGANMSVNLPFLGHVDTTYSNDASGWGYNFSQGMYSGYSVPTPVAPDSAIDVIQIVLRSTVGPAYADVDTALAWLMEDGSVRDFWSGTSSFVTFCDAIPGNNYYVEVRHRNHLPAMNNTAWMASTAVPLSFVDFRTDANIWGGGGVVQYGADFYLIGANSSNADKSVNALDLFPVLVDQPGLTPGYRETNVEFDNAVNAQDFNLVGQNSLLLRFSTSP